MIGQENSSFFSSIIAEIIKIYERLALYILHNRIDRYQKNTLAGTSHSDQHIKQPLTDCVDKIIRHTDYESPPIRVSAAVSTATQRVMQHDLTATPITIDRQLNHDVVGELSRYFQSRIDGAGLHPGIKDKLMHSTWDHVYAAIRNAKKRNRHGATMHITIANSACDELSRYMTHEEYQVFVQAIQQHLSAVMDATQSTH